MLKAKVLDAAKERAWLSEWAFNFDADTAKKFIHGVSTCAAGVVLSQIEKDAGAFLEPPQAGGYGLTLEVQVWEGLYITFSLAELVADMLGGCYSPCELICVESELRALADKIQAETLPNAHHLPPSTGGSAT